MSTGLEALHQITRKIQTGKLNKRKDLGKRSEKAKEKKANEKKK